MRCDLVHDHLLALFKRTTRGCLLLAKPPDNVYAHGTSVSIHSNTNVLQIGEEGPDTHIRVPGTAAFNDRLGRGGGSTPWFRHVLLSRQNLAQMHQPALLWKSQARCFRYHLVSGISFLKLLLWASLSPLLTHISSSSSIFIISSDGSIWN